MNKTELSNNLRQLIDIMYLKYSEIGISKIQYNEMVQKTLTYLLSKNNQKYHLEFIKKINELNFGLISNKYISNKFVLVDSYQVCLKNINDLAAFYHNIKYSPSLLELISLIKSNKTLSDNLKIVVDENIERIKLNGVESISSDENIYRLLTAYLEIHEIKVDEISQQEIYESLKNDNSISTDLVKEYMRQLDKPILNKDQEYELGLRILKGDKEAINTLVEHNLKLVIYVAKRYVNHGLSFLDLIQEGNIGLIKAAQRFDVTKGYRFSTYAIWWIRQAVMRAIDNGSRTIRIPVHLSNKIVKINKTRKILTHKLNREPSEEELAKELDMPIDKLREIYLITQEPVSLDMKTSEEDDAELQDFIADNTNSEEEAVSSLYSEEVKNIIDTAGLTLREKEILCYRFGFYSNKAMTLSEVAKIYDLTRERVRQIEAKALRKLKSPYQMRRLSENKIPVSKRYTELKNKEETQTYLFDLPLIGRYNNEDIILCLNKLSDIELQIVKFLFGNNFDQVINYSKPNYYKAFYSIIYPKLSKMLKQENKAKMLRKKF